MPDTGGGAAHITTGDGATDMRRWLIDGNNVMGSRPDGWWRDRAGAKRRLAAEVARWSASAGGPVVLFFDGGPDPAVVAAAGGAIDVRFGGSGRRHAADDAIIGFVTAGDVVVSADRGLIGRLPADVDTVGPTTLLRALGPLTAARPRREESRAPRR